MLGEEMEILFLGTGGGRFNLVSQERRTGGFLVLGSQKIHVDPGPGAIRACKAYGYDPRLTSAIISTHNHIDHVNDAGLMIEAMTTFRKKLIAIGRSPNPAAPPALEKNGILIASESVAVQDEYGEKAVSSYHLGKLSSLFIAAHGRKLEFGSGKGKATLKPIPVEHEDRTGFGFVLSMDGCKVGYTSDTENFDGMGRHYAGCDLLIANNLKAGYDGVPGHLYSGTTATLLAEAKPRLCALSHLGLTILKSGPGKEAKRIEAASGVRTIAAEDGMRITLPGMAVKRLKKAGQPRL